jgi:hypothetical protein
MAYYKVQSSHLPGGFQEIHKKPQNIQCELGISQLHVRSVTAGANLLSKLDMQDLWEN